MQFEPLTRVLIQRSNGVVESWAVIRYFKGDVLVGAAYTGHDGVKDRQRYKRINPSLLTKWQATLPDTDVYRPLSDEQLDHAVNALEAA